MPFGALGVQLEVRYPLRRPGDFRVGEKHGTIIVSEAILPVDIDPQEREWLHASLSWRTEIPSYEELALLHQSVFGPTRWSYQVFAASERHVNFHPNALHLWGLASGERALPDFGKYGMV
jgi:hypothetical protein